MYCIRCKQTCTTVVEGFCPKCADELYAEEQKCKECAELRKAIHEIMELIPALYREPIRDDGEIEALRSSVENLVRTVSAVGLDKSTKAFSKATSVDNAPLCVIHSWPLDPESGKSRCMRCGVIFG
jgi:hypothetical protein